MFLTKERDYGLRIMRALRDGEKRTVKSICDMEHIPHKYAYKILKKLQHAGFVQNKLGPNGGYYLLTPLKDVTAFDVVCAVDDNLYLVECLKTEVDCPNNSNGNHCNVHKEFIRIQNALVDEMQSKSMEEILLAE